MKEGRRCSPPEPLTAIRERVKSQLSSLPETLRSLDVGNPYPVEIADSLQRLAKVADAAACR
jgi:hypothetical protein